MQGKIHATWRVRYRLEQRGDEILLTVEPRVLLDWLSFLGPARFTITAPPDARLDVESRSAPIAVTGNDGGGSLKTTNGSVRVRLSGSPSLRLDARTTNGTITATRPLAVSEQTPHALVATVGDGTGELSLQTTGGAIVIE